MCHEGGTRTTRKVVHPIKHKDMTLERTYKEWQSLQPLSERQRHMLRMKFKVEFNYNSNHLEGNTLTYGQTELLLLFGKVSGEGRLEEFNSMKASEASVRMVAEEALDGGKPLTQSFIRSLHHTLLREDYTVWRELPGGVGTSFVVHAGLYKTRPNSVMTIYGERFDYASPEETPALMADLVDWYNGEERKGGLAPVELAALFHYRYIRIHPFEDGNGRMARLMANYILLRHGWPMVVVRSRKRQEYLDALRQTDITVGPSPSDGAHASLAGISHFLLYFKRLVQREMQSDIDFVTSQGKGLWWYDGERIAFRSHNAAKLLTTLKLHPGMSVAKLAQTAGINKSAMQKLLKSLASKGYIIRNGNNGNWHVLAISAD